MNERRLAFGVLMGMNVVWGATFFLTKQGVAAFAGCAGLAGDGAAAWSGFLALRFGLATLTMLPFAWKSRPLLASTGLWRDAFWLAAPCAAGFAFQTAGLYHTSPGISAFLTSLYVPLTPVAAWLLFRLGFPLRLLPALALAVAGLCVLTPPGTAAFGLGELLSAACGAAFAIQIALADRLTRRHDAAGLTLAMLILMTGMFLAIAWAAPGTSRAFALPTLRAVWAAPSAWFPLLFTATVATVFPFWAVNRYQKLFHPGQAAIIYATEPVFAAIFSAIFFAERFGLQQIAGASLVLAANAWAGNQQKSTSPTL